MSEQLIKRNQLELLLCGKPSATH